MHGQVGIAPCILNTVYVIAVSLAAALPLGVGAAKSIKMHKITDIDKFIIAIIEISNKKKIYRRWSYEDFGL